MPQITKQLSRTYLENKGGGAYKFWELTVNELRNEPDPPGYLAMIVIGYTVVSRWGKIGAYGQTKEVFRHGNRGRAEEYADDLIASKLRRGYVMPGGPGPRIEQAQARLTTDDKRLVTSDYARVELAVVDRIMAEDYLKLRADTEIVPLEITRILLKDYWPVTPDRALFAWEIRSIRSKAMIVDSRRDLPVKLKDESTPPAPPPKKPEPKPTVTSTISRRRLILDIPEED